MHAPRHWPTLLMTLALATAPRALAAQSSPPTSSGSSETTTTGPCDPVEAEADALAQALARCEGDVRERDGRLAAGAGRTRADAAIIAGLRVEVEDVRVDLRSRPSVAGVVGRTLATSCLVGIAVAGARYTLTETVDVWLLVVSGAQCVGAGVALGWGE